MLKWGWAEGKRHRVSQKSVLGLNLDFSPGLRQTEDDARSVTGMY